MSRATRSAIYNSENVLSSQGEKMDVTRGRGSRAFGRDITNATNVTSGASAKNASKVEKKSIFSSILPSQETFEESKSDVREYMQRPADDIDSRDASNPLLVTEYADRMYDHFRIIESKFRVNGNYMKSVQSHIKYVASASISTFCRSPVSLSIIWYERHSKHSLLTLHFPL